MIDKLAHPLAQRREDATGLRKSAPRKQLRTAMRDGPRYFKNALKAPAPLPIFLAIPLCCFTISPNDRMQSRNRQAIHPEQANTMKVSQELVHHHVPT
jgi:hypothetical protein